MMDIKELFEKLFELEKTLWDAKTRFDLNYMEKILAPEFFEFGRSGRIYRREDALSVKTEENIKAILKNFEVHPLNEDIILVTYISEVHYDELEVSNRSSIWHKTEKGWQIYFHQGTPVN